MSRLLEERVSTLITMVLAGRKMLPQSVTMVEKSDTPEVIRRMVIGIELIRGLTSMGQAMVKDYSLGSFNPKALTYYRDMAMDEVTSITALESSTMVTIFSDCWEVFGKAIRSEEWYIRYTVDNILDNCQKMLNSLKDGEGMPLGYKYNIDFTPMVRSNNQSLNKLNQEL
jgi:hypothetical protein